MMQTLSVRVSAGHVNMPLAPCAIFKDSAATAYIEGVPSAKDGVSITGVSLAICNAAGVTMTVAAKRQASGVWTATFPATHFAAAGFTSRGVIVSAGGTDENGEARTWILGVGDIVTIAVDSAATNLGEYVNLRLLASVPTSPVKGDLVKQGGAYRLYNGSAWDQLGGGGGGVATVNGKEPDAEGNVQLVPADIGALAANGTAAAAAELDIGGGRRISYSQGAGRWTADGSEIVVSDDLGAANGVATLGSDGKLTSTQLPSIPQPPTPVPIPPSEAEDEGQFADALAVKNELGGKVDADGGTATGLGVSSLTVSNVLNANCLATFKNDGTAMAVSGRMIDLFDDDDPSHLPDSTLEIPNKSGTLALTKELPYAKSSTVGTRKVMVVTATTAQSVTLPAIQDTDEVLNCDIVVNGKAATADFGLTLVGGTGVNVHYPNGETVTCKKGCVTMVSCVGISGLGWLVAGCNNLSVPTPTVT